MNTVALKDPQSVQTGFDLKNGFCWVRFYIGASEYYLQACLDERKECDDEDRRREIVREGGVLFKKSISSEDCGFDWGICGDTNDRAFKVFTQEACWSFFKKQIKKTGIRIN